MSAPTGGLPPRQRAPLLVLGFVGLVVGVGGGLARLGWPMPEFAARALGWHGPLMICGFFGVVISLERAVAIGAHWAYVAPLAGGLGTIMLLAGQTTAASLAWAMAAAVLLTASIDVWRRQREWFNATLLFGAAAWLGGNVAWAAGATLPQVLPFWLAFLVLTIAGERLELSRFLKPSPTAQRVFVALLVVLAAGLAGAGRAWGSALLCAALLGLSIWLLKQDLARRTVRGKGLTRFIAVCLLAGYVWLALAAVLGLVFGLAPGTRAYDAALHALLLGFVFSMVFGHAPIIFPAVLRVAVPYHPSFYAPLALLHGSVALRLAGDALGDHALLRVGGALNALALAAFIAGTATAVVRGRRHAKAVSQR